MVTEPDICQNRHGGNAESAAAWGKASISVEEWKAWILSELAIAKHEGRTCEELAESASRQLGRQIGQNVLSGRLTDLKREGQVTRSEITPRRKTASNCSAAVLVLPRYAKRETNGHTPCCESGGVIVAQCKSCGASIAWINLPGKDKPMPMDYVPIEVVAAAMGEPNAFMGWSVGSLERVHGRLITEAERLAGVRSTRTFRPHWSTCPHADQHRRDAGSGGAGEQTGERRRGAVDKPDNAGGRTPVREVQGRLF